MTCAACDDTGVDVGPCEVCGGDGRMPWGATCSRCKGSGETVYPRRGCGTLEEEDERQNLGQPGVEGPGICP